MAERDPPRDARARWEAMRQTVPRLETDVWPDSAAVGVWYRRVTARTVGPWTYAAPRGRRTVSEAAAQLAAQHGDVPVFVIYGERLYAPGPPPARGPTGFEVWGFFPDGQWYGMFTTRSERKADEVAHAHVEHHGLPARVYERTRKKRGDLVAEYELA